METKTLSFLATFVPRIPEKKPETAERVNRALNDLLLRQMGLWTYLRKEVVSSGIPVEFRLSSNEKYKTIDIRVQVDACINSINSMADKISPFLPVGYGWKFDKEAYSNNEKFWITRLLRKVTCLPFPESTPTFNSTGTRLPRSFPSPFALPQADQANTPNLHIPVVSELGLEQPERLHLLEEMKRCAPTIISVTIHPVDTTKLYQTKSTCQYFTLWSEALLASPFVVDTYKKDLKTTYNRLFTPENTLYNIRIRIGAKNKEAAIAVANAFAFCTAGLHAFELNNSNSNNNTEKVLTSNYSEIDTIKYYLKRENFGFAQKENNLFDLFVNLLSVLSTYYTEDEAQQLLRLPFSYEDGLPGLETIPIQPFRPASIGYFPAYVADELDYVREHLRIGVLSEDRYQQTGVNNKRWHAVPKKELCKHALITGSTGSGKTVATTYLISELDRLGIPILIIEPVKTEYYDNLHKILQNPIKKLNFEADTKNPCPSKDYFNFDPIGLTEGITVAKHVSYLKSCFQSALPMEDVMSLILENGLIRYYISPRSEGGCGYNRMTRGVPNFSKKRGGNYFVAPFSYPGKDKKEYLYPSFVSFADFFLLKFLPDEFKRQNTTIGADFQEAFRRRFENLLLGPLGISFEKWHALGLAAYRVSQNKDLDINKRFKNLDPIKRFLAKSHVLELDAIPDNEQKSLVMAFVLALIYEYRQAQQCKNESSTLHHCLVLEEAHRLLSNSTQGKRSADMNGSSASDKAKSMFVDMLAEIRALGESIFIVEQIPSKIVPEALKNTNLRIILRQGAGDDRTYLGDALNLTEEQKGHLGLLKPGEAVVFDSVGNRPLLVNIPNLFEALEN